MVQAIIVGDAIDPRPEFRTVIELGEVDEYFQENIVREVVCEFLVSRHTDCLLYTSDAADERSSVDLGGRRIIKKKKNDQNISTPSNNQYADNE